MKIFYKILFTMTLVAGVLTGCQPEELSPMSGNPDSSGSSSVTKAAGDPLESLHRNEEGKWVATRRVPLTGKGRIVNNIANSLITAVTTDGDSNIGNLVDDDLSNSASFGGNLADVDAIANQIVSVRDLDHVYAGGQTVGFTYRIAGNGLLSADVLKGFWIRTFLDGDEQDYMIGGEEGTNVLNLNLLSTLNDDGIQSLSFHTDKPFDEVQIGMAGINAELLGALDLYYVFVGDNDVKPVYTGSPDFPNAGINEDKTSPLFRDYSSVLVDSNTADGLTMELIIKLLSGLGSLVGIEQYITVDLGQTVEAGTEIGFLIQNVNVLELGLLNGIEFRTLDESGNEVETIKVEDDGLLGVSAIGGGKNLMGVTVKKPCSQIQIRFTGLDIKIGATTIYYAYVRDAVENDISTYFSASDVTISGNSYHLPQPSVGQPVVWTLTDWPSGSAPQVIQSENKIIGMTVDGDYTLTTTYSSSVSGYSAALSSQETTVSVTFTIHRRTPSIGENCNQLIDQRYEAVAYIPEGGGAFISTEKVDNVENVVDDDPENYATYHSLLSLASNVGLIRIDLKDEIEANSAQPTRVGFTMQTRSTFLDLDALKFFRIKLYNNGEQVAESVVDNNSTVSADLIGSRGNKVRMGFTTTKTFDRIELWSSGVLGLNLGEEYRIYNAFFEDGSENSECAGYDPSDACIEMLTPAAHGAEINYKETLIGGAATVGGSFNDLGNILDDDKETFAQISATTVGGLTTLAVKFDEMPAHTQVGFMLSDPSYVIGDVNILSGTVMEVFHNGTSVGSSGETSTGGLLGLSVIGYDGVAYLEVTPEYPLDEVRITFAGLAQALDFPKVNGAYIRRDSDGDGIPDCAEDDENPETPVLPEDFEITGAAAVQEHACGISEIRVNVTATGDLSAVSGQEFVLICHDSFTGNSVRRDVRLDLLDGNYGFTLEDMDPGAYEINISKQGTSLVSDIMAYIHPSQTTWKESPVNSDWNDWSNWTDGAPWTCTNVTLPENCTRYPELNASDENRCHYIYFAPGAELVGTQYLEYDYAWVDLSVGAGSYCMLSAPLYDMVTGDMFVPERFGGDHGREESFVKLTSMTSPEYRFSPIVYQRFWSSEVPGKVIGSDSEGLATEVIVSEADWTAPFNAVAEAYEPGTGFSLKTSGPATFRFPKAHTEYTYFNASGQSTGQSEGIARSGHVGRLLSDGMENGEYTVTVRNRVPGDIFVAGNPFMTHIDIAKFLEKNSGSISAVRLDDGNATVSVAMTGAGLLSSQEGYTHIAPMQGFYVVAKNQATELSLTFTEEMLGQKPGYRIYSAPSVMTRASAHPAPAGVSDCLRITAMVGGRSSTALVLLDSGASDAFVAGEDVELFIDGGLEHPVTVFTAASGHALEIQQSHGDTVIPVGFIMDSPARLALSLSHTAGDAWSGWSLVDGNTGREWSLDPSGAYIDLGMTDTRVGRYYLKKNR